MMKRCDAEKACQDLGGHARNYGPSGRSADSDVPRQPDLGLRAPARPLRLSLDLRNVPIGRYRLDRDGRKGKQQARDRMALAEWLATHGDADGSRIYPSVASIVRHFEWSHGKTCYLLKDLESLGLLITEKRLTSEHGTRKRRMDLRAFLGESCLPGLKTAQVAGVQDSGPGVQDTEQESNHTLDTTVSNRETGEERESTRPRCPRTVADTSCLLSFEEWKQIESSRYRVFSELEFRLGDHRRLFFDWRPQILDVKWRDIDWSERTIRVRGRKSGNVRMLRMDDYTFSAAARLRDETTKLFGKDPEPEWHLFFSWRHGGEPDPRVPTLPLHQEVDCTKAAWRRWAKSPEGQPGAARKGARTKPAA